MVCKDCGAEFVFTAGEQEFYAEKGFQNEPIRCKACRNARKTQRTGEREMYDAVCAAVRRAHQDSFRSQERQAHLLHRLLPGAQGKVS